MSNHSNNNVFLVFFFILWFKKWSFNRILISIKILRKPQKNLLFQYKLDFVNLSAYLADSVNVNLANSIQSVNFLPKRIKIHYLAYLIPNIAKKGM